MSRTWTPEELTTVAQGFQPACVLIAAAELDVFTLLHAQPADAATLAGRIKGDPRATTILLDALAALDLLVKRDGRYSVPADVAAALTETGARSVLGMTRHMGNCLRNWSQLAHVVLSGEPADCPPSVRGAEADQDSFIRAMHEISGPMAPKLIESLGPLQFNHLLDLGGGSGTWTIQFLRLNPAARATLFDLPDVIPMARERMKAAGLADRVRLAEGDFDSDALPSGADLAWVSAIVHQNSPEENRALFAKVFAALVPGGRILIRDIVMDESRTRPAAGALFAVNMLVATPGGGTFTFGELRDGLAAAGFTGAHLLRSGEWMDSVVCATKPG